MMGVKGGCRGGEGSPHNSKGMYAGRRSIVCDMVWPFRLHSFEAASWLKRLPRFLAGSFSAVLLSCFERKLLIAFVPREEMSVGWCTS